MLLPPYIATIDYPTTNNKEISVCEPRVCTPRTDPGLGSNKHKGKAYLLQRKKFVVQHDLGWAGCGEPGSIGLV